MARTLLSRSQNRFHHVQRPPVQQVDAGAAHLHLARNIFPALYAQIAQFQQQAAIRVRDQRDGLADLLLDVEKSVDLAVERALRFDQAHDRVLHAVDVPAVGHALAAVGHGSASAQFAQALGLFQLGVDALVDAVGLGEILLRRHGSIIHKARPPIP